MYLCSCVWLGLRLCSRLRLAFALGGCYGRDAQFFFSEARRFRSCTCLEPKNLLRVTAESPAR